MVTKEMIVKNRTKIREKPDFFEFSSYKFQPDKKLISFNYRTVFKNGEATLFTEKIFLPRSPHLKKIPKKLINNLLQGVHLILGISYYKLYCSPKIRLTRPISQKQAKFWNTVYRKGLGEFCYLNSIDPQNLPAFPHIKDTQTDSVGLTKTDRVLVGMGGGKDSIVAAELLKEHNIKATSFVVDTNDNSKLARKIALLTNLKTLKIRRILDPKLFNPNLGLYKGHVPISAIFSFLGVLAGVFYDYSYVTVANESSSDFGNIKFKGMTINHQWSKSNEFETLFQEYVRNFITYDVVYFSLLRPFSEIRIAKMFARFPKYFSHFSSCNSNFRINKNKTHLWCKACPKCTFTFLLLSAFLPRGKLLRIFGRNLFGDTNLLPIFRDILGFGRMKPFDCVGTPREARVALYLGSDKFKKSPMVKKFLPKILRIRNSVGEVFKANPVSAVPVKFHFFGMDNVLLIGYGKEGRATHRYLKNKFSHLKIGITDRKTGPGYLKKQYNFDIAVKTPGIPKKFMFIPYTTATNIFFSQIKNKTIGITGSKGKSTTASLIYELLKSGGFKTRLLGNIGKPMLEYLSGKVDGEEILVLELSSYQLDDIKYSPHIAVVLNLFPEHMDYHGSVANYYQAKKNIINFQKSSDVFVYNPEIERVAKWAKQTRANPIPFIRKIPFETKGIPLLGRHNEENIRAAVTVAKLFSIPDITIERTIKKFRPLPHRLEFVGEFKGIRFYDDAISTTPESTIAAIDALADVGTIFLGGKDRGYNFSSLEKALRKKGVKNIVLFPESGRRILKSRGGFTILETSSVEKAVRFAYQNTPAGRICLLSTASPSYSLWKNFEEKGKQFQFFVKKLGQK